MAKNEIHARLLPETMEKVRKLTYNRNFPTISHAVRSLIDYGLKNDSIVQIIEEEFKVFFAMCRDEYDPEDGQLYWFWFHSKDENSSCFEPDSSNNWCPVKRFNSQEDAIKDCLRQMFKQLDIDSHTQSLIASLALPSESNEDNVIDL